MTQEKSDNVFFAEGGITVTSTRLMIRGDMHTMNNIASSRVRPRKLEDQGKKLLRSMSMLGSILLGFLCAVLLWQVMGLVAGLGGGLIIWIAGSIIAYLFIETEYTVYQLFVSTNAGEERVMVSSDRDHVRRVERAISDAIASRG